MNIAMNTKSLRITLTAAFVLLLAGSLTGCFDEITDGKYHGPPLVQFDPGVAQVLDGSGTLDIRINLIAEGGALSQSHTFALAVDPEGTTADNFELLTPTVTIEGGTVITHEEINVESGQIPPGESETVLLRLQPSEDGEVGVAANFETFELTIIGRSATLARPAADVSFSGNVALQAIPRGDIVVIKNAASATEATTISNIAIIDDTTEAGNDADQFTLVDAPTEPVTLAPGDSTIIDVAFSADMEGDFAAILSYDATNIAANAAVSFGVGLSGGATNDNGIFVAELQPLNRFYDITGNATFVVDTSAIVSATIDISGLPGVDTTLHAQHIHLTNSCPTLSGADANGDGFIDVLEGVPAYGPILLPLDSAISDTSGTFPTGQSYLYEEQGPYADVMALIRAETDPNPDNAVAKIKPFEALDLAGRTVVVHGVPLDYELPGSVATIGGLPPQVTLPVACGTIERQ